MRIKKGDQVQIIAGKDNGKKGKVLRTLPSAGKIVVEKVNMVKKHVRARREHERGQRVEIAAPLDVSNAMLICPLCSKATRVGYVVSKDNKVRVCKKCKKEF
jgi:large subunit ribosomal protein L24